MNLMNFVENLKMGDIRFLTMGNGSEGVARIIVEKAFNGTFNTRFSYGDYETFHNHKDTEQLFCYYVAMRRKWLNRGKVYAQYVGASFGTNRSDLITGAYYLVEEIEVGEWKTDVLLHDDREYCNSLSFKFFDSFGREIDIYSKFYGVNYQLEKGVRV